MMYKWWRVQSDSQTVQDCQAQKIQNSNQQQTVWCKKKTEGTQMSGRNLQVTELLLQLENWTCMQGMPGEEPLLSTNNLWANNGLCVWIRRQRADPVEKMCDLLELRVRTHVWHRAETASRRGSYQLWNVMVWGPFSALGNGQLAVIQIWILHHTKECLKIMWDYLKV